jgi:hypothetical protein
MTKETTTEKKQPFPWMLEDGSVAPEWKLTLKKSLSNGVSILTLEEPSLDQAENAKKLIVYTDETRTKATDESSTASLKRLISLITKLPEDVIGEMKQTDIIRAKMYLDAHTDFLLKGLSD